MALNIGSMLVKAKFEAGNMMSGLGAMNSRFKESQLAAKQATTQFGRMKGSLMAMGATAALTSGSLLGMLMSAIMKSPFLAAALAKLKQEMMLLGNAIARHLAPILEKVVNFVKWLREKFQALPEPIQAGIVQFIALGIILTGLLSTIGLFILFLGSVKTALVGLGLTSAITKFGSLATVIGGSTLAMLAFGVIGGIVAGALAVLALDEFGVTDWIVNFGKKLGEVNDILRDLLLTIAYYTRATEGIGVIDLIRGDFDLTMMKESKESAKAARDRLLGGTSSEYGYGESTWESRKGYYTGYGEKKSAGYNGSWGEPETKTKIESQTNNIHIDMSNIVGNIEDPTVQAYMDDYLNKYLTGQNELLNV